MALLRYSWARYYHPGLGRFIAEDPVQFSGGDVNLYVYVWNDPTRFVDPFGVWGFGIEGGGYTASGGFAGESSLRQLVLGATAGLGTGLFLTNATKAEDLVGPFDTWTLNLPIVSFQLATAGGTWVGSFAVGRSRGFSVSRYSVTTTTGATLVGRTPGTALTGRK